MNNFKNLLVWKTSLDLSIELYQLTDKFPTKERYNLTSQINRCSVSIPSNIAEGAGRNSPKEFANFLSISNGSSYELQTQLIIANRLGFVDEINFEKLMIKITHIQKMIFNLQKTLKDQPK